MAKVTIKRRNESERQDGRAALYLHVIVDKTKIRIPLDIAVTSDEWDPVKERVRGRGDQAKDHNLMILKMKSRVTDILVRARLSGEKLTKARFLALYHKPGESTRFADYANQRLEELKTALQYETIRHHRSMLKKLNAYAPELQMGDITPEWLRVYAAHLRDVYGNNPGTIGKNIGMIRMHYYGAMRAGLVKSNPFEVYKMPLDEPLVVFLTEEELNSLIDLYRSERLDDNEQAVLRFFLFMTFTGMHFTDALDLQIEQVFNGEIHYRRVKTKTRVSIPLSKSAEKLFEFYRDDRKKGNLFQKRPSNQNFNRLIKIICGRVGINKAVSAKAARHTFATLYYKKNPGDLGTLSKLLGHTSVNTTMIYAHIMKESRISGISAFDDLL